MKRKNREKIFIVVLPFILLVTTPVAGMAGEWDQPTRPVSYEVVKVGPGDKPECRDELEVWGIGLHKDKKKVDSNALLDARRAACWYVLMGSDGLLVTQAQRECFEAIADDFYSDSTVRSFVPWVSDVLDRRKLEKKGRKVKLQVRVNVDYCMIKTWLEDHGCPVTVWSPMSIMVLPDTKEGVSPLAALDQDENARMAKTVVENFLTVGGEYETLEPDAATTIEDINKATDLIEDNADDYVYRLALMFGADIYFRYEVMFESTEVHGAQAEQAIVRLEAYETTTARKLGAQTAYSEPMTSTPRQALVEDAISRGTGDILTRVQKYRQEERNRGVQYLIILAISEEATEDDAMEIQDGFVDCSEEFAKTSKEDIMTTGRIKARVWVDAETIKDANRLGRALRKCLPDRCPGWKVRVQSMGKLISGEIAAGE